jgi:hypothetical protein
MKWSSIIEELRNVKNINPGTEKYAEAIRDILHDPIVMSSLEGVYRGSGILKRPLKKFLTAAIYSILKNTPDDSEENNCETSRLIKHLSHNLARLKHESDPSLRRYGEVADAMNTELRIRVVQAIVNRQPTDIQIFVNVMLKEIIQDCANKKVFISALTKPT